MIASALSPTRPAKGKGFFRTFVRFTNEHSNWFTAIGTLLSLAALGGAIALTSMLWGSAVLTFSSFMSAYAMTLASIAGLAVVNHWFSREIQMVSLGAKPCSETEEFGNDNLNLVRMVDHLRAELNAHYDVKEGDFGYLPRPRVSRFTDHHPKLVGVPGRNPGRSAIFISSGMLDEHLNLTPKELAALIMVELHKARARRGMLNTIVSIGVSFAQTLENFNQSDKFIFRALGMLSGPFQLFLLLQKSLNRHYSKDAMKAVIECGRGQDLQEAQRKLGDPACNVGPKQYEPAQELNRVPYVPTAFQDWMKQVPLLGRLGFLWHGVDVVLKPLADWIDANEVPSEDKGGYRFFSFFDILALDLSKFMKEIFSDNPSANTTKTFMDETLVDCMEKGDIHIYPPVDYHATGINNFHYDPLDLNGPNEPVVEANHNHAHRHGHVDNPTPNAGAAITPAAATQAANSASITAIVASLQRRSSVISNSSNEDSFRLYG